MESKKQKRKRLGDTMIELFIVVPDQNTGPWKCDIKTKGDFLVLASIIKDADRMLISGETSHNGKSFLSVIPGMIPQVEAIATEITEDIGSDYIDCEFYRSKEDLFLAYPELQGTEQSGTTEDGEPIVVEKLQFTNWAT